MVIERSAREVRTRDTRLGRMQSSAFPKEARKHCPAHQLYRVGDQVWVRGTKEARTAVSWFWEGWLVCSSIARTQSGAN